MKHTKMTEILTVIKKIAADTAGIFEVSYASCFHIETMRIYKIWLVRLISLQQASKLNDSNRTDNHANYEYELYSLKTE